MSDSGLGFGGFLLGLGIGWYLFQYIELGFEAFSYLLILMGIGMILSGLLSRSGRKHPISGIYGGVLGGLFLAAVLTQGFGFIVNISDEFTEFSNAPYRVTQGFTLITPVTGDTMELDIDSVNGGIDIYSWGGDEIKWEMEIKAKGNTNKEAEDRLDEFQYDLSNELVAGVQEVSMSFPLTLSEWRNYAVVMEIYIPESLEPDIIISTTNGEIRVKDITCTILDVETTNGGITLGNLEAFSINAETTNGVIRGTISTTESTMKTTNGAIDISLTQKSGVHDFKTTNGLVELNVPTGNDIGYDVSFDTSIGALDINLPDLGYSLDTARSKIGKTSDYTGKSIQIQIKAQTTIGGIKVN